MTEKRVKAWAVVTKRGSPVRWDRLLMVYTKRDAAESNVEEGERVVPVTIVWEEK